MENLIDTISKYARFSDNDYTKIRISEQRVERMTRLPNDYSKEQLEEAKECLAHWKKVFSKKYKIVIA